MPFTQYEAENAATNGSVLARDRTAGTLASEGAGRSAVTLNGNGQYVSIPTGTNIPIDNSPYTLSAWFNATTYRNVLGGVEGIVGYGNIQFTKAPNVLRGMGLSHLSKNQAAIKELADKGMAPT